MDKYRATRVPGGSYVVHETTWGDEAGTAAVTGAASAAGWAIGAGISGLTNLARNSQDRRFARAIETLEDAYVADDDDRLLELADYFTRRYPDIASGQFIYAEALERKGQFDAALQALDRAEQLGMDDTQVHFLRAGIYGQMEVYGTALQEITYSLNGSMARSDPSIRAEILLTRVIALSQWINDYDMALRDANESIALMPQSDGYRIRGDVYRQSGDFNQCLQDYTRAIQLSPNDPDLRERRADVYEQLGRREEAAAERAEAERMSAPQSQLASSGSQTTPPPQTAPNAQAPPTAETAPPPYASQPEQPDQATQQDGYRSPGNGLATVAIIFAFLLPPLGLILGIIARVQVSASDESGKKKALVAIVVSILVSFMFLQVLAWMDINQ